MASSLLPNPSNSGEQNQIDRTQYSRVLVKNVYIGFVFIYSLSLPTTLLDAVTPNLHDYFDLDIEYFNAAFVALTYWVCSAEMIDFDLC